MSGYLSTTQTIKVRDDASGLLSSTIGQWAELSVAITIDANGAVSYTATVTHSNSGWQEKSIYININGHVVGGRYYTTVNYNYTNDFNSSTVVGYRFPIDNNTTFSATAGTATGDSITYDIRINSMSDGSIHGWDGSASNNYKGTTEIGTITRTKWTEVKAGKIEIKDNLNNSFTITAEKGDDGEGDNTAGGPTKLKWGYTVDRFNTYTNGQTIALTRQNTSSATRTVYAAATTTATYGEDQVARESLGVKQYYAPEQPGVPVLTEDSYKNGRLTLKKDWEFTWKAATKQGCSDVKGYRLRVKKNGSDISGLVYNSSTNSSTDTLTLGSGTNATVDTESLKNSISFNPSNLGFKAGDTVQLHISAYSKNGQEEQEWTVKNTSTAETTSFNLFSDPRVSDAITVQNAGIVHVKVNNQWKEGQVYVKINGSWKEAETVNIKTSTGWKESQ